MKYFFLALISLGMIQASLALAQEDGSGRRHGRGGDGTFNNSPRAERSRSSENQEAKREDSANEGAPREKNAVNTEKKQRAPRHRESAAPNAVNAHPSINGSEGLTRRTKTVQSSGPQGENHVNPSSFNSKSSQPSNVSSRQGRELNRKNPNVNKSASIPAKVREMGVTRLPDPIRDRSRVLTVDRKHSSISFPKAGPGGKPIDSKIIASKSIGGKLVQTHMNGITKNAAFMTQVNIYNRSEVQKNNYYWHSGNGFNYCHYYDNWGYHWYGWYVGPRYFWTRYYGDNWWWYDEGFGRWCYWHAGGWWWQDPARVNVIYVYNNNDYTPVQASAPLVSNDSNSVVYQSNDGTRKVKVMGDGRDAFLYDTTQSPAFDPLYLASGVRDVKFSDTSNDKPLQIMLTLTDGTFQMFDTYGNGYNKARSGLNN